MNSSYKNTVTYEDIFKTLLFMVNPKSIIEVGILDGFSLNIFSKYTANSCQIKAYDIFDEFNGNCADKYKLMEIFKDDNKVTIEYGDFYNLYNLIDNVDIIHIDIANNGDIYELAIEKYLPKMSKKGVLILEGGSEQRDNVGWMDKYNKPKIQPVLKKYENMYSITTIGDFPSLTIIKHNV